jgi:hypothetical protein
MTADVRDFFQQLARDYHLTMEKPPATTRASSTTKTGSTSCSSDKPQSRRGHRDSLSEREKKRTLSPLQNTEN